jgi:Zn-dependent M16 (insulinase) family peptidase
VQVVLARAPGPITHAFFAIATEAHDDDGLPHTLEHLIFLGSEAYPYKGVLDMAANRLFARGTNAWTATDHTAYTATHAGAEGLLALLPVYADHVLFPTITAAGYTTEVHHVNGEGADAGVVVRACGRNAHML